MSRPSACRLPRHCANPRAEQFWPCLAPRYPRARVSNLEPSCPQVQAPTWSETRSRTWCSSCWHNSFVTLGEDSSGPWAVGRDGCKGEVWGDQDTRGQGPNHQDPIIRMWWSGGRGISRSSKDLAHAPLSLKLHLQNTYPEIKLRISAEGPQSTRPQAQGPSEPRTLCKYSVPQPGNRPDYCKKNIKKYLHTFHLNYSSEGQVHQTASTLCLEVKPFVLRNISHQASRAAWALGLLTRTQQQ